MGSTVRGTPNMQDIRFTGLEWKLPSPQDSGALDTTSGTAISRRCFCRPSSPMAASTIWVAYSLPLLKVRLRPERGANRHVDASRAEGTPDWFLPFVRKYFGHIDDGEIVHCCEAAARKGKITPTPVFEFAASQTVAGRIVVVGDAAHLCSPRTAQGAHTTALDAEGLWEAFAGARSIDHALRVYNEDGTQRAAGLFKQSRMLSRMLTPKEGKHAAQSPATLVR